MLHLAVSRWTVVAMCNKTWVMKTGSRSESVYICQPFGALGYS